MIWHEMTLYNINDMIWYDMIMCVWESVLSNSILYPCHITNVKSQETRHLSKFTNDTLWKFKYV